MSNASNDTLLWNVSRASRELGLSERYLRILIRDHEIDFVRIGRRVLFHPEKVRAWLETRNVPSVKK